MIHPFTSPSSVIAGFSHYFTFIYSPPHLFAYSLGYRHLSSATRGCATNLRLSFRAPHLYKFLNKALYLILIFVFL